MFRKSNKRIEEVKLSPSEYTVKYLVLDEVKEIYETYIYDDFPKEEVKPLKHIVRMWEARKYFAFGMYDKDGDLLGYAFMCDADLSDFALLDYLAMTKISRGKGMGSIFLKEIAKKLEGYVGIIIETEAVDSAENDEHRNERISRNHFYEMNGVMPTGLRTNTFGVIFDIWCLPIMETYFDKKDIKESLDEIYTVMIDDEKKKKERFKFIQCSVD